MTAHAAKLVPIDLLHDIAFKEAHDLFEVWQRDPAFVRKHWPKVLAACGGERITLGGAILWTFPYIKRRYAKGKCRLCKGPAMECAPRHRAGRSCA